MLPPSYTKASMAIDDVSGSWVLNCRQPAYFCELETDENYKHVGRFLREFLIWNLHRENAFLSKKSELFVRDMGWLFSSATAVNENILAKKSQLISIERYSSNLDR